MNENELQDYYQRYIAVLQRYKEPTELVSNEELNSIIYQLFNMLQHPQNDFNGNRMFI
jgi:hypothetical protein